MRDRRVLLVDNDPDDRALISRLLGGESYNLVSAADGVDFAEQLARGEFDMVIAERELGWGDGLRLLDAVKAFHPDCPVILLTQETTAELVSRAVAVGLDALLPKSSAGLARLPATVDRLLARHDAGGGAEAARRRLTQRLPVGVFSLTPDSGITRANPALASLLGCRDPAELWGEALGSFFADPAEATRLDAAVEARDEVAGWEIRLARRDGREGWARLNAWPAPPPTEGEPATRSGDAAVVGDDHYDGTLEDITEYQRVGQELARRAAALDRSNAELQSFADVVSHDLQAPLGRIDRYADLLARTAADDLGEEQRGYLDQLAAAANQMEEMLAAILEYARVTSRDRRPEQVDLEAALAEVLENLAGELSETGGSVTHDELPVVRADRAQMSRLLQNLVGNGLKFHTNGAPKVHVSVSATAEAWKLCVADNGIGIPADEQQRIFKMFERLHPESEYPGSGVGLAICQRIAERHGGHISVRSAPGQGSTFTVAIPRHGPHPEAPP